jgi:hypothetical protein
MIKSFLLSLLIILSVVSCSSQSKNFTKSGDLRLRGGVYGDERWNDFLVLSRHSWFQELTLLFEVLVIPMEKLGPFESWLSPGELSQSRSCENFSVVLVYSADSSKISETSFFEQARLYGHDRQLIPDFGHHLKLHPDFDRLSLQLYKPYGLCKKSLAFGSDMNSTPLSLNFPGFNEVKIH